MIERSIEKKQEDGEENFLTQEMPEHEKPFPASPS